DAEPKPGYYSLSQPAIKPIFRSRASQESFLAWAGEKEPNYFNVLQQNWRSNLFRDQTPDFQTFWDKCLYDGVVEVPTQSIGAVFFVGDVNAAASDIAHNSKAGDGFELVIYENETVGNGSQDNNPILHDLPDPITKAVW